jgi:preprotein translocase SecE subunit
MKSKSTFVGLFFVAAALVVAWALDRALAAIFAAARVTNTELLGERFTLSTVIALVVAAGTAFVLFSRPKSKGFVGEVVDELFKVNWPDWAETKVSTLVVIVTSLIAAAILGVFDITFGWLSQNNLFLY